MKNENVELSILIVVVVVGTFLQGPLIKDHGCMRKTVCYKNCVNYIMLHDIYDLRL